MSTSKEHILAEIKRTASGNKPLGRRQFEKETGITQSTWYLVYWTSWGQATLEAGYEPNRMQAAYPDEYLLRRLSSLTHELGHFPKAAELRMKARSDTSFPSHNTFRRLGGISELARLTVEFCEGSGEFDGVAEIIRQRMVVDPTKELEHKKEVPRTIGFVYLMKSGKYHKVGRSKHPDKRNRQINHQLPEPVKTIHTIQTDDPSGIEAYWHRRFSEKRQQGEWFLLTKEDIAAFKHRKTM